jgi:tRNA(fMet)-specific endonuclease VapC
MDSVFLLDTNVFIYLRQKRSESVVKRFKALRLGEAAMSIVTYGELFYGAAKSKGQAAAAQQLRELTSLVPVLPLPVDAGEQYGFIRADLESKGQLIGNNDLWIAAHALCGNFILVTNNEKEFRRVRGLRVQNWLV